MKIAHIFADDKFESRGIKFSSFSRKAGMEIVSYLRKSNESYYGYLYRTVKSILNKKINLIHAHRISGFLPAIFVKILRPNMRIIYDKHDIHKYDFIFDRLQFFADYTIVCSELHLKHIKKFKKKSIMVSNYSDFKPITKYKKKKIRGKFGLKDSEVLVLFQGSIIKDYGLDMLIDILPNLNSNIKIGILGWVKDKEYWDEIKKKFTDKVIYFGTKEYEEMNDYVGAADIGVVLFQKSKLTLFGNPAKLFEFISCKVPVIVTDIECVSKYIKKYKNGVIVKNKKELANAINKLSNKKIREEYSKKSPNLKWEDGFKKYLKILKELDKK